MGKPARVWALPGSAAYVSLGRSQHPLPIASALPVRRRASGGGAVLAGPWLLRAAVRLPRDHVLTRHGPAALAAWLGQVHVDWLEAGGIANARLHRGPGTGHWACFAGRSPGEVLVDGRKLTGIAQVWRRSGVLAMAGTLLDPPAWPVLCDALGRAESEAAELARTTISVRECVGHPLDAPAWARSLRAVLQTALLQPWPHRPG